MPRHLARRVSALMVLGAVILLATPVQAAIPIGSGWAGTNRGDDARTAWYPSPVAAIPAGVTQGFGTLFTADLGGKVYAQPVVAGSSLIVATESDTVAALDPVTGAVRWQRTLGIPILSSSDGCDDISPLRGVTSTPVVDPATGDVFLVDEELRAGTTAFKMHRLNPADGTDRPGVPVRISGDADNQPETTFDASAEMQRPGLLLLGGVIYAAFASHCDQRPYNGWVAGISRSGQLTSLFAAEPGELGEAGIWQSGAGLSSDGPGQILLTSGNGSGMAPGRPGHQPGGRLGSAALRLKVTASGALKATDFFQPYDQTYLSEVDADFGTGGLVVLPDSMGTATVPHLAVTGSKAGWLYLLDRDNLGGSGTGPHGSDGVVARINLGAKITSTPSVSPTDGLLYVSTVGVGYQRQLVALRVNRSGANPTLSVAGTSTADLGFGSSSPSISTKSGVPGTSLVWVVRCGMGASPYCADAALDVYQGAPVDGHLVELASWPIPAGAKFAQPLVVGKSVYVATATGVMGVGKLPASSLTATTSLVPSAPAISASGTAGGTLSVTSPSPVTLTSLAFSSPAITADPSAVTAASTTAATSMALPLSIDTTKLAAQGEATSDVTIATSGGTITVPLVVHLTAPGPLLMEARPAPLFSFGGIRQGGLRVLAGTLTNIGHADLTISAVAAPPAPFSFVGSPLVGQTLAPGASLTYQMAVSGPAPVGLTTANASVMTTGGTMVIHLSAVVAAQ